jgi:hypothetical protein
VALPYILAPEIDATKGTMISDDFSLLNQDIEGLCAAAIV